MRGGLCLVGALSMMAACSVGKSPGGFGGFDGEPWTGPDDGADGSDGGASGSDSGVGDDGSGGTGGGTGGSNTSGGADDGSTGDTTNTGPGGMTTTGGATTTPGGMTTTGPATTTTGGVTTTTAPGTTTPGGMTTTPGNSEVLSNSASGCNAGQTLWCTNMTTMMGVGQHSIAECFDLSALSPPVDITKVDYYIYELGSNATSFNLEVREWNGSSPGAILQTQALTAADFSPGFHTVFPSPPISVNESSFCVGFYSNGAFSADRDDVGGVAGRGFLQAPDCGAPGFVTFQSLGFAGNWCLDVTVESP